ncbi:MAG: hypothetical protein HY263_04630 [Chloroflexi bacterium]|nr:hypothetical protein [Chloroflexota bacterium]
MLAHPTRRLLRAVAAGTLGVAVCVAPVAASYNQNIYNSGLNISQETDCWCAVVTAKIMVKSITSSFSTSQTTMNSYMATKDKYNWGGCGHDPRGVAWAVYNYTPAGYYFNDYRYTSQSTADWEMVDGIRATAKAVGASVAAGMHAVAIVGYNTTIDPFVDGTNSINGFYVVDPWYPHNYSAGLGSQWNPSAPPYGLPHNSSTAYYLTRSSWDSQFFYTDTNEGSFYNGYYVPYLRSTSGAPSDSPPETYGDWYYRTHFGPMAGGETLAESQSSHETSTPTPTLASIELAVRSGVRTHGLEVPFGLHGYAVSGSSHVDSLASGFPSYDLVVLRVAGSPRALALVYETPNGYVFAGLAPVATNSPVANPGSRVSLLQEAGLRGTGRLVWAGVAASQSTPFEPLLEGVDARGSTSYVGPTGRMPTLTIENLNQANR